MGIALGSELFRSEDDERGDSGSSTVQMKEFARRSEGSFDSMNNFPFKDVVVSKTVMIVFVVFYGDSYL